MTLGVLVDDVVSGGPRLAVFLMSTWLLVSFSIVKQSAREMGEFGGTEDGTGDPWWDAI